MPSEDQLVVRCYCSGCEKDVECPVTVSVKGVAELEDFHRDTVQVKVEIKARCPKCSAVLGRGWVVVELY